MVYKEDRNINFNYCFGGFYMEIIEEKEFSLNGIEYIARTYRPDNNKIYSEIVFKSNGKRPNNMKNIAREYLRPLNIEISTDARIMVTHKAIKILMDNL